MAKKNKNEAPVNLDIALPTSPSSFFPETIKAGEISLPSQTYYHSKTYVACSGINRLVTAASPLYSLTSKLKYCKLYENPSQLLDDLVYEIKAFECQALANGYHSEIILIARYALCALLDETIASTDWGPTVWQENNLLNNFQEDQYPGDTFFIILEKLMYEPRLHIDLLELMYICLSLGFQGKYQARHYRSNELENLVDNLFHIIKKERGDVSALSSPPQNFSKKIKLPISKKISIVPLSIITACILVFLYCGFNYLMQVSTQPLYQKLANLTSTMEAHTNVYKQV